MQASGAAANRSKTAVDGDVEAGAGPGSPVCSDTELDIVRYPEDDCEDIRSAF